jgi:hypothetical protein
MWATIACEADWDLVVCGIPTQTFVHPEKENVSTISPATMPPRRRIIIRNLTLLHGQSGILPRLPSANERSRFFPSRLFQLERRTGARGFVNSSTVKNQRCIL